MSAPNPGCARPPEGVPSSLGRPGEQLERHWVFFLEEPSAEDFLRGYLPAFLPPDVTLHFQVFEGKQDLEKRLVPRLKHWRLPHSRFIVMRDQDSGNCVQIKTNLKQLCQQAGHGEAVVRIACRELESFFVGDMAAVATAFDKPGLAKHARSAKFKSPDTLGSPSDELKKLLPGYGKRDGARRIAPQLSSQRNHSVSFQVLHRALQRLADEPR